MTKDVLEEARVKNNPTGVAVCFPGLETVALGTVC